MVSVGSAIVPITQTELCQTEAPRVPPEPRPRPAHALAPIGKRVLSLFTQFQAVNKLTCHFTIWQDLNFYSYGLGPERVR